MRQNLRDIFSVSLKLGMRMNEPLDRLDEILSWKVTLDRGPRGQANGISHSTKSIIRVYTNS